MNKWKGLSVLVSGFTAIGCFTQPVAAASYIVETFDTVIDEQCLEYQPYDDAGKLVISLNQDMHTYVTVKQLSQEKESYLFYDLDLNVGETTYVMPLEAGDYEVTIGVPYANNSKQIVEYAETITIENPDFNLDLQSTMYHYTLWRTEKTVEAPVLLQKSNTETDGIRSVYRAFQFQQISTVKGDVNEDGVISVEDAVLVLTYYAKQSAGLHPDTDSIFHAISYGDIDENDTISVEDAVAVLTYYARQSAGLHPDWKDFS